jgi:nucleotide-binding universal stress UspA family protein
MSSALTDAQPDRSQSTGSPQRRVKVVGYDGSANGRNVVEAAARRVGPGDRLIIVHALEPEFGSGDPAIRYDRVCQQMIDELDPSILDGIDYELRVVHGRPAQALIDVALHTQAMAIVVGTRRAPSRLGRRTIRSELEAGPVPVVALVGRAERESHHLAEPIDSSYRHGYDSFPASDPPSSWGGPADDAPTPTRTTAEGQP